MFFNFICVESMEVFLSPRSHKMMPSTFFICSVCVSGQAGQNRGLDFDPAFQSTSPTMSE